ncbi:MAG: aspartate ammonia-lyase, partial [Oscillospiraceae bacterium]|nr:aspartate ammonia-lyase [Oscillospiraceae bacterium]
GIVTVLAPYTGYERAADIAKKALETGRPVRDIIAEEGIMEADELDRILDPYSMTEPTCIKE